MTSVNGPKRKLTVAIVARNAAEEISETLVSIRNIADEILVLDTGSTDDTALIAEKLGGRVLFRPWEDSFAAARNHLQIRASGDFLLWMDAGEVLTRDNATLLREFVDQGAQVTCAYQLRIGITRGNAATAGEQIARVRLVPHRPGLLWHGLVRENLERSLFSFGMPVEPLPIVIQRGPREQNETRRLNRARRNVELADLQIAKSGPSAELYNCLGESLLTMGQPKQAARYYQQAKEVAAKESCELLEAYYGLLACLDYLESLPNDGDASEKEGARLTVHSPAPSNSRETQLSLCLEALEVFPLDAHLLVALGGYLQAVGNEELAQRSYEVAYRHGQIVNELWHLPDIREIAATCKAMCLRNLNQAEEAISWICQTQKDLPHSVRLGQQALDAQIGLGNAAEALAIAYSLPMTFPDRHLVPTAVEGAVLAWKGNWSNALELLEKSYNLGLRQKWSVRWYAQTLFALGNYNTFETVLPVWESVEPNHPQQASLREQWTHLASIAAAKRGGYQRLDGAQSGVRPLHSGGKIPQSANEVQGHTNYLGRDSQDR